MNILVTGGAGYIGSITTELLVNKGHTVTVVDDLRAGYRDAVVEGAELVVEDIGNYSAMVKILQGRAIDVVVHFAAFASVPESMIHPGIYFTNNLTNSILLLRAMVSAGCQDMIFSSTSAVFGNPERIPIDETHPMKPCNPYGESKLMFERILDWYHEIKGIRFNAFRYFCAAGATEKLRERHDPEYHLIPVTIDSILGKRGPLEIFGDDYDTIDGTGVRDFIHVVDIAQAHILAIDNLQRRPTARYNLGSGTGFSVRQIIEAVERVTGLDVPHRVSARRLGDPPSLVASSELAEAELGWTAEHSSLDNIIRTTYDSRRNNL
ncbi:MAG: UDP-glucose 4-epimerase GalE [Candidatus Electryoneaceae bacterium]|nr:UDP-glucose 4-epimerase GalE [Candidatus Electryoneaceae bacterium]